ncbi:MAG TPA: DUF4097 family beta strand repeat-containing protein [Longimicrobium sp.]|nr:DUF4097 family beta strand repeat-containing protein [Longimicrobium sp.]
MRVMTMMAAAALLGAGASRAAAQTVNQSVAADPTGTVEVHAVAGQLRVVGWSRNQVQVTGQLGGAGERVEVEDEDGSVVVRVVYPRGRTHNTSGRGTDLEVRVPARSDLEVNVVSADASVAGLDGDVQVHSVSGGIRVANSRSREISVATRSGTVEVTADADRVEAASVSGGVTVSGTVRDRVEANSVSGMVRVTAAAGEVEAGSVSGGVEIASMRGRAEVHSVSGDVRVTGRALSGTFQTVSGEITLVGDLARGSDLELTTHSGSITLQVPASTSAQVDFTTFSGDIEAQFPGARVTRTSRREIHVVIGGGNAARVTAQTFSGDVRLERR